MKKVPGCAILAFASALSTLTACGGGGSGDAAPAPKQFDFSPYEGTWSVCNSYGEASSARYKMVITQAGPGRYHYAWQDTDHPNANCSGDGTLTYQEQGDVTEPGESVTVDQIAAQKVTVKVTLDGGASTVTEIHVIALTEQGLRVGSTELFDEDGTMHFASDILTRPETIIPQTAPRPPVPSPPPPPPLSVPAVDGNSGS